MNQTEQVMRKLGTNDLEKLVYIRNEARDLLLIEIKDAEKKESK
jgi:hypothetical protein